ncbi:tetratricopeptide repeat protein [Hyalangium rubrum]|uniref:Tetratricopeptide repeat protein n=1 Tax=Hyalangium rubrum TaxID=3103134 RepID=A0ABU5HA87_9BACT|nr:tetratricopeptide repeat protein [Hyalangium sp. s54d21]MDY7229738.1 tetratricopeptide repeat protein [Hyalangium sp. s54d21]
MSLTDTERAHLQSALQKQRDALAAMRFTASPVEIGQGLIQLAELHGLLEDHAASRQSYEEALGHFQSANNKAGQAQALYGLGVARAQFEDHKGSIERMAQAAALYNEVKDREGEALCRACIGESLRALGHTDGAEEKYQEALILFRQTRNTERVAALLMDIGDIRMEAADYKRARERFLEALTLLEKAEHPEPEPLALCQLLLGEAEGLMGNHEAARPHLLQAVELYTQLHEHVFEARARWDLGLACYYQQDWPAARSQFEALLPLYEEQGRADEVAKVRNVLAHFTARGV